MLIETTLGSMEESDLEKRTGLIDNENENTAWVEYWYNGELVHRSVHVHLKKGLEQSILQGIFGDN